MSNNESSLPKWAQKELQRLRHELSLAGKRLLHFEHKKESDISYGYGVHGEERGFLPPHERFVTFHLHREAYPQRDHDFIRITHKGDRVEVHGSEAFNIEPGASNTIDVVLRDFG